MHTIEARGHAYGTNVFDNASGRNFNFAGMIPAWPEPVARPRQLLAA